MEYGAELFGINAFPDDRQIEPIVTEYIRGNRPNIIMCDRADLRQLLLWSDDMIKEEH